MQNSFDSTLELVNYAQQVKKNENIKVSYFYNFEVLRPIFYDGTLLSPGALNISEVALANDSTKKGYTHPIWVGSDYKMNTDLVLKVETDNFFTFGDKNIFNCDQFKNYYELAEKGLFVKPFEFKSSWNDDRALDLSIEKAFNLEIVNSHTCLAPFVSPESNVIYMPPKGAYENSQGYYQNLFHELSHIVLAQDKKLSSNEPRHTHEFYAETCAHLLTLNIYNERHKQEVSPEMNQAIKDHSANYLVSWKLFDLHPDKQALDEFCKDVSGFADKVTERLTQTIEQTHSDPNNKSSIFSGSNGVNTSNKKVIDVDPESYNKLFQQGVTSCLYAQLLELSKGLESQISYQVKQKQAEQLKSEELNKNAPSDNRSTPKSKDRSPSLER